jgi:hypothetical protein
MVNSSGTFSDGGDQESSKLNDSIRENTEKLGNLTKVLSSDSPTLKEMKSRANEVASSEVQATGRKFALQQQAQLDKLAANNFRATETIISELLSRFGGTSFYPALSAFRVARESVAVGTGKTQSELDVMDIIKFVNDSSKELLNNMFTSFGESIGLVKKPIDDLNASLQETAEAAAKAAEEAAKTIDIKSIQEETMPTLTEYGKAFTKVSLPGGIEKATVDELNKALTLIQTTDELATNFADVAIKIATALKEMGEAPIPFTLADKKEREQFKATTAKEMQAFDVAKNAAIEEKTKPDVTPEAIKAARTAAGIAGLGVTSVLLSTEFKELAKVAFQTGTAMKNVIAGAVLNPQGMSSGTTALQPLSVAAAGLPAIGNVLGASIGTALGGPIGGLIGSKIGSIIGSTVGVPIQAAVSILTSIENGVSQIKDSLVGFSPDVTLAIIERDLSLLADDMRRSNQIGDEVARITGAQTNLQIASRRAFDNLVELAEPFLVTIANSLALILNATIGSKNFLEAFIQVAFPVWGQVVIGYAKSIAAGLDTLADLLIPKADIGDINSIVNVRPDPAWFGRNNLKVPVAP